MIGIVGLGAVTVSDRAGAAPIPAPCRATVAGLGSDGSVTVTQIEARRSPSATTLARITGQVDSAATPFLSSGRYAAGPEGATSVRTLTPVNGRIADTTYTRRPDGTSTSTQRILGTSGGWDHFRLVIDAYDPQVSSTHWIYGLHPNGRLYRYRYVPGGTLFAAGSVPGMGNVKTMAFLFAQPNYDALLATTTDGQLLNIDVSRDARFYTATYPIRTATWQNFDSLNVGYCPDGPSAAVIGVQSATRRAFVYAFGPLAGPKTRIAGYGPLPDPVATTKLTSLTGNEPS